MDDLERGYLMAVAGALVWSPRPLRSWLDALKAPRSLIAHARSGAPPPGCAEPLGAVALARLASIDDGAARRAIDDLARCGGRLIADDDVAYPAALRDLHDPPPVLYVRGDLRALEGRTVAIVGSRAATTYGRTAAGSLASDFSAYGACVISGLARGVDAAAHKGAMAAHSTTVAVIGSGLSALYPPYHALLADEIVETGGAVVSEFPPAMQAMAHHFPMRNRVVASLANATVVVEAGARSGALITARLADELGRPVFAVPGDIGRATSEGTNGLIKDGVPLVTSAADIAALLGWDATALETALVTGNDDPLMTHLDASGISIEELSERSTLDVAALLARLTLLEIRGLVVRLPGGAFAAVKPTRAPKAGAR